jgi:hypothetical protein
MDSIFAVITGVLSFLEDHDGAIVAIFTILLAISTIGLWHATGQLAKGARAQATDLKESLSISRQAADAASANAKAALISGRAHIWVDGVTADFERDNEGNITRITCVVRIRNGGPTPGLGKLLRIHMFREPIENWPANPVYKGTFSEAAGLIGPQDIFHNPMIVKVALSQEEFAEILGGTRALIFYGSITYSDVFEPNVDHVSGFAYRLTLGAGIHQNTTAMCGYQGPDSYWHYS